MNRINIAHLAIFRVYSKLYEIYVPVKRQQIIVQKNFVMVFFFVHGIVHVGVLSSTVRGTPQENTVGGQLEVALIGGRRRDAAPRSPLFFCACFYY